jgi:hypothetical protein
MSADYQTLVPPKPLDYTIHILSAQIMRGQGCHGRGDVRRIQRDLGAAVAVVCSREAVSRRRYQPECIDDASTLHRQTMKFNVVVGDGSLVKRQPSQVEDVAIAKKEDHVAEQVVRQRGIFDREPSAAGEGDLTPTDSANRSEIECAVL